MQGGLPSFASKAPKYAPSVNMPMEDKGKVEDGDDIVVQLPKVKSPSSGSPCINKSQQPEISTPTIHRSKIPPINTPHNTQMQPTTASTPSASPMTPTSTLRLKPISLDTSCTDAASVYARMPHANKGINDTYPHVTYIDNKWTELSCGVCRANATQDLNFKPLKFYGGPIGLSNHISSHRAKGSSRPGHNVALKCFKKREISKEDAELIQTDHESNLKMTMCIRGHDDAAIIDKYLNIPPLAQEDNKPEDASNAEEVLKGKKRMAMAPFYGEPAGKVTQEGRFLTGGCDQDDEEDLFSKKRTRRG